jgi:hypothetical protein
MEPGIVSNPVGGTNMVFEPKGRRMIPAMVEGKVLSVYLSPDLEGIPTIHKNRGFLG